MPFQENFKFYPSLDLIRVDLHLVHRRLEELVRILNAC